MPTPTSDDDCLACQGREAIFLGLAAGAVMPFMLASQTIKRWMLVIKSARIAQRIILAHRSHSNHAEKTECNG